MRTLFLAASVLGVGLSIVAAAPLPVPPIVATARCESCHGAGGDSQSPGVPRLNGQSSRYLISRLSEFLDLPSQDPHAIGMNARIRNVRNEDFATIAAYFASQPPTAAKNSTSPIRAKGLAIFAQGAPAQDIDACATCHGANAEGAGPAPRLAGQHGTYLRDQLERLRLLTRVNAPMFHNTSRMTDEQIAALVAYLAND